MNEHTFDGAAALDATCGLPLDTPFTARVARAEGVPRQLLSRWCRQGLLRQPIRRVYVVATLPDSTMLRAHCLSLVVPEDAVICDRHAGWLLGAEMTLAPNEHLNVMPISMFRPSDHGRLRNDLAHSGERNLRPEDITEVMGLPVTTALRTAWDLGRVRWRERAICGMDQMLRLPGFPHEAFMEGVERFRGERWVRTLRSLAPLADSRAESPPESVLRLVWLDCGLPRPVPQLDVWIGGALIARLDVGNADLGYAAEYDGAEWHSSPDQREHDRYRRQVVADAGYVIDAFTKTNVFGRTRDLEQRLVVGARRARAAQRCRTYV